ncbi:Surfeit locus protein 1 [Halocaridina rubra]|uniref:SURF1-like protein n=1 Tax=Halocaridina rubra TaxID=373956 RepID=A0AAN8WZ09_HALRR
MNSVLQCGIACSRKLLVTLPKSCLSPRGGLFILKSPQLSIHNVISKRMMSTLRSRKTSTIGPAGIFLLTIPVGTFCLGTWQYQRRQWKLNLIAELEAKTAAPAVPLPENLEDLSDMEYQKVRLTGTFDHSKEIYMGPRAQLVGGDVHQAGGGLISSSETGFLVITPFKLADRDLTILINRGWVSRKFRNPQSRMEGQLEGPVHFTAVVRKTENRAPFTPDNRTGSLIFTFRDVNVMAEVLGTSPICLDAVETFPGGPTGGQTRVTLRNEHLSYMFTWYSLSLATSLMWYFRFIRRKPIM